MLGIAVVVVVAIVLLFVSRRSRHPRGIGAFRNRATGASPLTLADDDGGESTDSDTGQVDSDTKDDRGEDP